MASIVIAKYGDFILEWHKADMYSASGSFTVTDRTGKCPRRSYPEQSYAEKYAAKKNAERIKDLRNSK